ncbi:MAG TPA: ShlB/FhaC/HecB family hemolysin secretion/activation protein, partial [Solimonas sp.]
AGAAPDTVDVDLEVEDQLPLHGSLEINDRYTANTRRLRLVGSVSYANLFQRDHSLSVQTQVAPQDLDQTFLLSASYLAPFPRHDFNLVVYGVHSKSDVGAVSGINVLGSGDILGVRGVWNFMGEKTVHTILAGADYKSFKEDLVLGADTASTPIDYMPFTIEYSLNHSGDSGDTEFRTSLNGNTRGISATDREFGNKRVLARANYLYGRMDLSRHQKLPGDFRLIGSASGQIANGPRISTEGFSLGGWDSVRGYLESQEVGDSGINATLQLETPSMAPLFGSWLQEARLFAFYDWGKVYLDDALSGVTDFGDYQINLYSAGMGLRLQAFKNLNLEALLAAPLKDRERMQRDQNLQLDLDDRYRVHFRLWAEF